MSLVIAQADRASWQRQAVAGLTRILDDYPELPCIAWTVGPAGAVVIGRISGLAPSRQVRQVFAAWREALALGECRERPGGGGTSRLQAAGRSGGVTVRLTATVFGEREGA